MKNTSFFTVGRFQVTPSKDTPPFPRQEPRPLWQATPTAHSPPPLISHLSESSESSTEGGSESDSSISTVTVSPTQLPLGFHGTLRGEEETRRRKEEEEKEESTVRVGRRVSVTLLEGSTSNPGMSGSSLGQSWGRPAPSISSDESENESEECWVELQELRER